jgi:hypothetical protein
MQTFGRACNERFREVGSSRVIEGGIDALDRSHNVWTPWRTAQLQAWDGSAKEFGPGDWRCFGRGGFLLTEMAEFLYASGLKAVSRAGKLIVGTDIAMVEFGWAVGRPTCPSLASRCGLLEARSSLTENRIARVLFRGSRTDGAPA